MTRLASVVVLSAGALVASPPSSIAQTPDLRTELSRQFEASARKLVSLAEAMPADSYDWQPGEGVYTVARVYAHIARYNYLYPDQNLGLGAPLEYGDFEETLTEKDEVVAALERSMDHVRGVMDQMSDAELSEPTRLYGRDVANWAVLLQLVTHMNEHLGQAIAYARTNGVAPPWSM